MPIDSDGVWAQLADAGKCLDQLIIFNPRLKVLYFSGHRRTGPPLALGQHYECSVTPFGRFCNQATSQSPKLRIHGNGASCFLMLKSPDFCQERSWKTPH